jgi:serine/threonine protein kinase
MAQPASDRTSQWEQQKIDGTSEFRSDSLRPNDTEPVSPSSGIWLPGEGEEFGDYVLEKEIARGGMGVVFRAKQKSLGRTVALKMILSDRVATDSAVRRFEQEARAAAALDHPHIVPIYEISEHRGRHYFTMAFVEGKTLKSARKDNTLSREGILRWFVPIVQAVAYAHQHGIIHRDLKPDNVLIDKDGRPRVTDFGLAKKVEGESELTSPGSVMGTPAYMAPEQARGDKKVGPEADVYALGGLLYFLIAGRPPFCGETMTEVLLHVVNDPPEPPHKLRADSPMDLEALSLRCLAKAPAERFANAGLLLDAITELASGTPPNRTLSTIDGKKPAETMAAPSSLPAPKKSNASWIGGLVTVAAVVGAAAWFVPQFLGKPADKLDASLKADWMKELVKPAAERNDFGMKVSMLGSRPLPDGTRELRDGQEVAFQIETDRDAYVGVWTVEADGTTMQLFPNEMEKDHLFKAGTARVIPGKEYTFSGTASKGIDHVRVVASTRKWVPPPSKRRNGAFPTFDQETEGPALANLVRELKPRGIRINVKEKDVPLAAESVIQYKVSK